MFFRVSLVSGKYPCELIKAWDQFKSVKSSYNSRPGKYILCYISDNEYFKKLIEILLQILK